MNEMLSVKQVAERLSVGKLTIYREIETGKLPAHRIGKQNLRIKSTDLEKYIEKSRVGA